MSDATDVSPAGRRSAPLSGREDSPPASSAMAVRPRERTSCAEVRAVREGEAPRCSATAKERRLMDVVPIWQGLSGCARSVRSLDAS